MWYRILIMSEGSFDDNNIELAPATEILGLLEHVPDELDRDELLVLAHGLTGIVRSLRQDVKARDEVIDTLKRKVELAELVVEEHRKYDTKTGLLNSGAFRDSVEEAVERRRQDLAFGRRPTDKQPTSNYFVFIDLDDFGLLNDSLDHNVVDQVILLPAVERILRAVRDDEDYVGRHGGDEFLVFLTDIGEAEARMITERIKSHINTVRIPQTDLTPELGLKLGASIGVVEYPIDASYDEIFNKAHRQQRNSKVSGSKNEIHFADDKPAS
jgi:diguanylate cyclase (GGDEF)-like protein